MTCFFQIKVYLITLSNNKCFYFHQYASFLALAAQVGKNAIMKTLGADIRADFLWEVLCNPR